MKVRRPLITTVLSTLLLLAMIPMSADSTQWAPAGDTFKMSVKFEQAFLVDGGARFEKGLYDVVIRSLGDGNVRATFTRGGQVGHASGKGQWGDRAAGLDGISYRKASGGDGNDKANHNQPNTFATYGFTAQSPASFQQVGNQLKLNVKGHGNNQIQVGLGAAPSK